MKNQFIDINIINVLANVNLSSNKIDNQSIKLQFNAIKHKKKIK